MKVLAAKSEGAFREGRCRGWWALGHGDGVCLGTIVWFEHDGHVRAVDGVVGESLAKLVGAAPRTLVEPWSFFAAGAPKKKVHIQPSRPRLEQRARRIQVRRARTPGMRRRYGAVMKQIIR